MGNNSLEWYRSDTKMEKSDTVDVEGLLFMVMDVTRVANHDGKGQYLYMLQMIGEETKINNKQVV